MNRRHHSIHIHPFIVCIYGKKPLIKYLFWGGKAGGEMLYSNFVGKEAEKISLEII